MNALIAEEQRRQAMLSGDIAVLEALLSDGLVYVHSTGGARYQDHLSGQNGQRQSEVPDFVF